jgi:hypothetical protein
VRLRGRRWPPPEDRAHSHRLSALPAATAQDNGPKSGCYPVIVRNSWANREITQEIRDRFRAVGEANKGKSLSQAMRAKISVNSCGQTNPNAKVTEIQVALIKGTLDAGARC